MKLLIVRHGRIKGDPFCKPQFPVSGCLNDEGIAQAETLRDAIKDVKIDAAFSSAYGRAMQTGQIALEGRGINIRIVDGIEEWHPVQLEREVPNTEYEKMLERDKEFYLEETWKTEQGEGTFDMYARVVPALLGALAEEGWHNRMGGWIPDPGTENKTIAIFAHGGSISTMLAFLLQTYPSPAGRFGLGHTAVAQIGFNQRHGIYYPYLNIPLFTR